MGIISIDPIPGSSIISAVLNIGTALIDRLFPDPQKAAEAKLELLKMQQAGELAALDAVKELALGQLKVNEAEASNTNWFIAGWRPAIGWVCGLGLAYNFVGYPIALWGMSVLKGFGIAAAFTPPPLFSGDLITLVFGMLGLGAARTVEKIMGAEGNR